MTSNPASIPQKLPPKQRAPQRSWQRALAAAERLAMPYEAGLAHYELGRHLPTGDPERTAHLEMAHNLFEETGAAYHLAKAQALLDVPG